MPSLHEKLRQRMAAAGVRSQTAMTVMSPARDPFRQEKRRPEAEWLAAALKRIPHRPVYVRGLHYAALGTVMPDGTVYENTDANAQWIGDLSKAARWLGLIAWDDIYDNKNDAPLVVPFEAPAPEARIELADVEIFPPDDLAPTARLATLLQSAAAQARHIR